MQMSPPSLARSSRRFVMAALSVAIVGALAVPQQAQASAFQLKEDSAKAMGRAYAGQSTAGGDVSVVADSPAAMTDLKGTYFQADVTAINFGAQFSGSAHDAMGRPISGGNGGNAGSTMPVPALFFATQVSDRWHLGAAFTAPFGFQTEYDRNWVGRYNAIKSKFQSLDATLSASFDVTDNFSLGGSVIAQKTSAELTSAVNFNAVGQGLIQQAVGSGALPAALAGPLSQQIGAVVPPGSDGFARIKADDWAYGWQLGGYWKLSPNDKLDFNYRAKIEHRLEGTANYQVPANVQALLPTVGALLGSSSLPFTHTNGAADFDTPAVASASYWHQAERFGLGIDVSWTQWSSFKNLDIEYQNPAQPTTTQVFNWRNSWYVSIGGDYYVTDKLTLRGGIGVDSTPTYAATRDARVPDSTRKLAAVGLGYKASEHFEINVSYAHIFVNNAHINATSATNDVLTGNYDDYGNLLSLSAQYKF
jgi:long-chain fatty acid transport protein